MLSSYLAVRLDTLRLLRDMVDSTDKQQASRAKDTLLKATVKLAPDADAGIREHAQAVLVAFALKLGSYNAIQPFLSKLDDSRAKMIEEAVIEAAKAVQAGNNTSRSGGGGAVAAPVAASARPSTRSSASTTTTTTTTSTAAPKASNRPAGAAGSKTSAAAATATARSRTTSTTAAVDEDDSAAVMSGRLSTDEAAERLTEMFSGGAVVEGLRSSLWQERLEAMTTIAEHVTATAAQPDASTILLCLSQLPGWGDKNFQVVNKCLEVATGLANSCPGFSRLHAAVVVEGAGDKIHELKHRLPASEALTAASEAVSPRFVVAQLHTRAAANKNPKVLSESLTWIATAVEEFGLVNMDLGALLGWLVADLGSPNAPVRNQAMAVLGRCHVQVGGGLLAQLSESLKPAQVTALEEIFRKSPQDSQFQPTRKVRSKRALAAAAVAGGGAAAVAAFREEEEDDDDEPSTSLDDLLPRTNISSALTSSLLGQISSSNWKERNSALEEIEGLLNAAGNRIQPELPTELFAALRGRLADTNRNLAARTLLLIGKLADAVGAPFDRLGRPVLIPALGTLSDNKKQVRDAAVAMLDAWVRTCPAEKLFPQVADVVGNQKVSADGRVAALGWMTRTVVDGKAAKCADSGLRAATVALGDKTAAVRDGGNQLLTELTAAVGGDEMMRALATLDSSTRKQAEPLVTKAISSSSSSASSKTTTIPTIPAIPATAPSSSRPSTTTAAVLLPPSTLTIPEQDGAPPLLSLSSTKAVRARLFRTRPGKFEAPSPDEIDALQGSFAGIASDELIALLFSRDFKDHVKAADALSSVVPHLIPEAISCLDLIFRWAVVRVCEGNTQTLVRVLEMLRVLLDGLADSGYRLAEVEANALLPGIIEKSGHNQDRVRALHRDVVRAACAVYPTVRVVDYLTVGVGSKNSRTKVECCEMLTALVETDGAGVVATSKAKPLVAIAAVCSM